MKSSVQVLLSTVAILAGCESAKFASGALPNSAAGLPNAAGDNGANASKAQVYGFGLAIGNGAPVVGQAMQTALPSVYMNNSKDALAGADLDAWKAVAFVDGATPGALDTVKSMPLDLTKSSGTITVRANFAQTAQKRTGTATASVFVDAEPPKATLLRLASTQSGDQSQVFWSATDNYRINEAVSELIGCSAMPAGFTPKSHTDFDTLPAGCVVVYKGADLHKQPPQLSLSALEINGAPVPAGQTHYGLYVEDMVGLNSFLWITEPSEAPALLTLTTLPAAAQYSNVRHVPITLQLNSMVGGTSMQVDSADNSSAWSSYDTSLTVSKPAVATTSSTYNPTLNVDLTGEDGVYSFDVQVNQPAANITSNHKTVLYILDTIAPAVSGVKVDVPGGILNAQSTVNLSWNASDANGITQETVEIMQTGDTAYTTVGTITGAQTTYSFPWGTRSNKGFVIRITATDPAGNKGQAVSLKWTPQVFNAAVLTSSVQCYFCHVKIVGDLGGINFPTDAQIVATNRTDTGTNFNVTGNIYGTTGVPTLLAKKTAGSVFTNYANDTYKIFPKNNVFPVITAAKMIDSVNGSLTLGSLFINRVYTGNLVLDGSQPGQPIQLSGEVFITGDLVIKGSFKGVGTIYAQNIYVVNDLVALNSPFPFDDDPVKATAQAVDAVTKKTDALYLGALNQVVVGSLDNSLDDETGQKLTNTTPYSWMPRTSLVALGTQAVKMNNMAGVPQNIQADWIKDPTDVTNLRTNIEVDRVDAYIYAQVVVMWRAYANILLNGGFMSPRGGIVTTVPYGLENFPANANLNLANNPRNGLPPTQNIIRYDYRLRTGGAGFETIKSFFDQQ